MEMISVESSAYGNQWCYSIVCNYLGWRRGRCHSNLVGIDFEPGDSHRGSEESVIHEEAHEKHLLFFVVL